jgi:hypothetical protein
VSEGLEIVLATALVQNCQLKQALAVGKVRRARAATTPYVAAGETIKGFTTWSPWIVTNADGNPQMIGVKTVVDTSAARFAALPVYQAQVRGTRYFGPNDKIGEVTGPFVLDGTMVVGDAATEGFTTYIQMPVQLRNPGGPINPAALFEAVQAVRDAFMARLGLEWTVAWVGVET